MSQINDIPLRPKFSALNKNSSMNEERFGEEILTKSEVKEIRSQPETIKVGQSIKKTVKPVYQVASFRLLDSDIDYIKELAKTNNVPTRDIVKSMIDYFKTNNK
jgi:hypothetical protein